MAPDAKTLIISTGTSGKGMGAAGTDVNDEIDRCTAVAQAANALAEDGGSEDLYVVTCFSDRDKLLGQVRREDA